MVSLSLGGRGITVCDRWVDNFDNFLADMGAKPTPTYSIDRIDGDGNYEPSNCRWATKREQSANRSNTVRIAANGETLTLTDWARRLGCQCQVIRARLRKGWSPEKTATTPVEPRTPRKLAG